MKKYLKLLLGILFVSPTAGLIVYLMFQYKVILVFVTTVGLSIIISVLLILGLRLISEFFN